MVIAHRRDAEGAERKFLYKKPLRALRLCGEPYKNDSIPLLLSLPTLAHFFKDFWG